MSPRFDYYVSSFRSLIFSMSDILECFVIVGLITIKSHTETVLVSVSTQPPVSGINMDQCDSY